MNHYTSFDTKFSKKISNLKREKEGHGKQGGTNENVGSVLAVAA